MRQLGLAERLRMANVKVNALHLQAVEATGAAFWVRVQWLPELLFYRTAHRRLFGAFVGAVG